MTIKRAFCPVDFSETSRKALRYAGAIATWYEAVLHVVHVVPDPAAAAAATASVLPAEVVAQLRAAANAALHDFIDEADLSAPLAGQSVRVLSADEALAAADQRVIEYVERRRQDACEALRKLAARDTCEACETCERVELGSPAHTILRLASEIHADLIVMGAQGHGPSGRTLFGSATQTVLRRATCPVLTARAIT
jgi:nucleotide-binding universal stress UspA family protein